MKKFNITVEAAGELSIQNKTKQNLKIYYCILQSMS